MIVADQPFCFPDDVLVAVSSRDDGTVLDRAVGIHNPGTVTNRTAFCQRVGVSYGDTVYQRIIYGPDQSYDRLRHVGEADTCKHIDEVQADALITDQPGVALMLPVADCVATVVYDPSAHRLALAHLGRHSSIAGLMARLIDHLVRLGSDPTDLLIWMAPSVKQASYRMEYFDHKDQSEWQPYCWQADDDGIYLDLQGYNRARAIERGVSPEHIVVSLVDTATDPNYFSHSDGDTTGRFAVLAMIRRQASRE